MSDFQSFADLLDVQEESSVRVAVLGAAHDAVTRDRAATHGDVEDSFTKIAGLWSVMVGVRITPAQVAIMMGHLKDVRAWNNPGHPDNWIDKAGYAACGGEIAARDVERSKVSSGCAGSLT